MLDTTSDAFASITLRPYQVTCVERVLDGYQRHPLGGRALVILPTGCGKTLVFAEVARRLGLTTLIIAHRQELLQQAADKFRMIDPTALIGQVGAGRHEWGAPITVASVQTLCRPEWLGKLQQYCADLIIIDECHHSPSAGYQAVLRALPDAFALGVTATADRLDRLSVESIFGVPVFNVSIIDMIEQGYLSNLRAIAIPTVISLDDVHTQAGDFKLDELEVVIDTPVRNAQVVTSYQEHCSGRQGLCFAITVAHAEHMAQAFGDAGVRAAVVCGWTPPDERKRILSDYEQGSLSVLCNVGVLTEGYDHPNTACILMARPTRSRALYIQSIGRGTRLAPGKTDCIILDITDNTMKHRLEPLSLSKALGIPLGNRESVLEAREKRARTTTVTRRTEDIEIQILQRMGWQCRNNGVYGLEVGEQRHLLLLVPSATVRGNYCVQACLAPYFRAQVWQSDIPLEHALQYAEKKAQFMLADKRNIVLVDHNAPWRTRPVTYKQIAHMRQLDISLAPSMTCGEAADLIDNAYNQAKVSKNKKG